MRIYKPEELEKVNYIFGKAKDNKVFSPTELKALDRINLIDKNNLEVIEMENNMLTVFENKDFGRVRTINIDKDPWFVAKDVMEMFKATNRNRLMQDLEEDEKGYTQIDTPGGPQKMAIINESGLYSLLFAMTPTKARGVSEDYIKMRTSQLKQFKRWITHEVIPSIRKTGKYEVNFDNPMYNLAQSQNILNKVMMDFQNTITKHEEKIEEQQEKISKHDELLNKRVYISSNEAKEIQIAITNKVREIALDNNIPYHKEKSKLFSRVYRKLNAMYGVAQYRELPAIKFVNIINTIKDMHIYIADLIVEDEQISL